MRFNRILCCIPKNNETIKINENMKVCYFCKNYNYLDSECKKFARKDFVTNLYTYEDARRCREDENKCGKQAKYYEELTGKQRSIKSAIEIIYILRFPLLVFGGIGFISMNNL